MKKYTFNDDEMTAMMMALIGRRNTIKGLMTVECASDSYKNSYIAEMATVEGLLEKFFPGSVSRLPA